MCGIVGVFNKGASGFIQEQKEAFAHLLLLDTLRGEDSTGAFLVNNIGEVSLAKEAKTAGEFLKTNEYKKVMQEGWDKGSCIIGHNRKATKGDINDTNAHPFVVDDKIVLVHNGGIWGDHKKLADVEVDSHAIAHLLANNSIDDALSQFHGAYALMWYNVDEEAVYIVRNKERPLWFMETHNAWYWASERIFLQFAQARCNLKVVKEASPLEEDSLNCFKLEDKRWITSYRKIKFNRAKFYQSTNVGTNNNTSSTQQQAMYPVREDWMQRLRHLDGQWEGSMNDEDTVPFESRDAAAGGRKPSGSLSKAFLYTVGGNNYAYTSEFERELARQCNRMITAGEFNREVAHTYHWGGKVKGEGFEYVDDGTGGYYLYASPCDDPQVIIRHHFPAVAKPQEERIMHMALNNYEMEFTIDKKCWSPFNDNKGNSDEPTREGYCIVLSSHCKILNGGGIKSEEPAHA